MRKVKFRGKRFDGHWVYGFYYQSVDGGVFILEPVQTRAECIFNRVDPVTVGQYIGRKDKNDVEIYEGDIVRYGSIGRYAAHEVATVVWWGDENYPAFDLCFCMGGEHRVGGLFPCHSDTINWLRFAPTQRLEVIGNIHDNPELLE